MKPPQFYSANAGASYMLAITANLLFALTLPAAPAPAPGADVLPKDLIDLIPDDSAAVLVMHAKAAKQSKIGLDVVRLLTALDKMNTFPIKELIESAEHVVIAQFAIEKGLGDFAFIIRTGDGETLTKGLAKYAKGDKDKPTTKKIGTREVISFEDSNDEMTYAIIDARTVMLVMATGTEEQARETLAQAYGERKVLGPHADLRKMVEGIKASDHMAIVAKHAKIGHAFVWTTILTGHDVDQATALNEKIEQYRGTATFGDTVEVTITTLGKDANAAKEIAESLKDIKEGNVVVKIPAKVDVEGRTVTLRYALTKDTFAALQKSIK